MKQLAFAVLVVILPSMSPAQIPVTTASLSYFQDFDGLDTMSGAPFNTVLPAGWVIAETGTGTAVDGRYRGGNGSSSTGDTYSFGSIGSSERSLGSITSGTVRPQFGAVFTNNTGSTVIGMTISYRGEQWRKGTSLSDTLRFYYGPGITTIDSAISGYVLVRQLCMSSVDTAAAAGALDGNMASSSSVRFHTIPLLIPPGASIAIKWIDADASGTDHGLAVDSLSISFSTGTPAALSLIAVSPADNATAINPGTNLTIAFDKQVQKGNGFITVMNVTDQLVTSIPVVVADVSVAGNIITVTNVGLVAGKSYWVTFDSTAFDTAGIRSQGIYDTAAWSFATSPTSISATPDQGDLHVLGYSGSILSIEIFMEQKGRVEMFVADLSGRVLTSQDCIIGSGRQRLDFKLPFLPPGLYCVRLYACRRTTSIKLAVD